MPKFGHAKRVGRQARGAASSSTFQPPATAARVVRWLERQAGEPHPWRGAWRRGRRNVRPGHAGGRMKQANVPRGGRQAESLQIGQVELRQGLQNALRGLIAVLLAMLLVGVMLVRRRRRVFAGMDASHLVCMPMGCILRSIMMVLMRWGEPGMRMRAAHLRHACICHPQRQCQQPHKEHRQSDALLAAAAGGDGHDRGRRPEEDAGVKFGWRSHVRS